MREAEVRESRTLHIAYYSSGSCAKENELVNHIINGKNSEDDFC